MNYIFRWINYISNYHQPLNTIRRMQVAIQFSLGYAKNTSLRVFFCWVSAGFSSRTFIGIDEMRLSDVLSVIEQDQTGGEKA